MGALIHGGEAVWVHLYTVGRRCGCINIRWGGAGRESMTAHFCGHRCTMDFGLHLSLPGRYHRVKHPPTTHPPPPPFLSQISPTRLHPSPPRPPCPSPPGTAPRPRDPPEKPYGEGCCPCPKGRRREEGRKENKTNERRAASCQITTNTCTSRNFHLPPPPPPTRWQMG